MSPLTPKEQLRRQRIEGLLSVAAPVLDRVLAIGAGISRIVRSEGDHHPARPVGEAFELPIRPAEPRSARD